MNSKHLKNNIEKINNSQTGFILINSIGSKNYLGSLFLIKTILFTWLLLIISLSCEEVLFFAKVISKFLTQNLNNV